MPGGFRPLPRGKGWPCSTQPRMKRTQEWLHTVLEVGEGSSVPGHVSQSRSDGDHRATGLCESGADTPRLGLQAARGGRYRPAGNPWAKPPLPAMAWWHDVTADSRAASGMAASFPQGPSVLQPHLTPCAAPRSWARCSARVGQPGLWPSFQNQPENWVYISSMEGDTRSRTPGLWGGGRRGGKETTGVQRLRTGRR